MEPSVLALSTTIVSSGRRSGPLSASSAPEMRAEFAFTIATATPVRSTGATVAPTARTYNAACRHGPREASMTLDQSIEGRDR